MSLTLSPDRRPASPIVDQLRPLAIPPAWRRTMWIALAVAVALVPASSTRLLPVTGAWALAMVVGCGLAVLPVFSPSTLAAALIVATGIAESSLVPDAGSALPAVTLAIPLLAAVFRDWLADEHSVRLPPRPVLGAAGLYLGVMAISITVGAATGWRPNYPFVLTGLVATGLLLGLVVVPHVLAAPSDRVLLLSTLVALGPLLFLSSVVLAVIGPISLDGTWVGAWLHAELTTFDHPTGLIFARVTGPFARPAGSATVLAVSMIALIGLRRSVGPLARLLLAALLPALGVLLFLAQNRDGWLIMATAGCLYALVTVWRERRVDVPALVTGAVFLALLSAMSINALGANVRQDASVAAYGPAIAATIPGADDDIAAPIRGGAGLNGRQYLWRASLVAIRERPLLGWGLGSDQDTIGPRLDPSATRFAGLTSDSLYLVTAVETGLLGLLSLLVFIVASLLAIAWRLFADATLDATAVTMGVTFAALLAGGLFETYRLGWVVFPNLELALSVGLTLVGPPLLTARRRLDRPGVADDARAPAGVAA